jgi:6-phosphogluconolactonase
VANDNNNTSSAYSVAANGALTAVPDSPFAAGAAPSGVAVDPAGKFVYVTNAGANTVSAYSIGANGALTPIEGSPYATGNLP